MATWALVFFVALAGKGGPAVVPGFSSKASCEVAGAAVEARWSGFVTGTSWVCVEIR